MKTMRFLLRPAEKMASSTEWWNQGILFLWLRDVVSDLQTYHHGPAWPGSRLQNPLFSSWREACSASWGFNAAEFMIKSSFFFGCFDSVDMVSFDGNASMIGGTSSWAITMTFPPLLSAKVHTCVQLHLYRPWKYIAWHEILNSFPQAFWLGTAWTNSNITQEMRRFPIENSFPQSRLLGEILNRLKSHQRYEALFPI